MNFNNINNDMNNLNTPNVLIKYTSSIFNKSYENNDIDIRILDNKYLHLLLKDRNKNTLKYISLNIILLHENKYLVCEKHTSFRIVQLFNKIIQNIIEKNNDVESIKLLCQDLLHNEKRLINDIIKHNKYYYFQKFHDELLSINNKKKIIELNNEFVIKNNFIINSDIKLYKNLFLISYYIWYSNTILNTNILLKSMNYKFNNNVLPGGHTSNIDNTLFSTVVRELKEESGIRLYEKDHFVENDVYYVIIYDKHIKKTYYNLIYTAHIYDNIKLKKIFKINNETKKIKWFKYNNHIDTLLKIFNP